jgi:hypothetical protein
VGHPVSEVIPGIQRDNPELFELYGRVAQGGAPESFETYLPALDIWFLVSAFRPVEDHFVAVFENITARKQAEEEREQLLRTASLLLEAATAARRGVEMYGEARLMETVADLRGCSAQELADGILQNVGTYADRLNDDIQVVALRLD